MTWTDNRDGAHDVADPVTDTNAFMAVSSDEGATWSAPIRVTSGVTDKWFPWVAARGGKVGVLYQEEASDGSGTYNARLATSTDDSATRSYQTVSTAVSDPNHSVWFQAHAGDCPTCSRFIGDYIGLAFDTLGRAHMTWTCVATCPSPSSAARAKPRTTCTPSASAFRVGGVPETGHAPDHERSSRASAGIDTRAGIMGSQRLIAR